MDSKPATEQNIGRQLLKETAAYAKSSLCRRKLLLHYFGEDYAPDNCHNCDNCLHPKERLEGREALLVVLHAIMALKKAFSRGIHHRLREGTTHRRGYRPRNSGTP